MSQPSFFFRHTQTHTHTNATWVKNHKSHITIIQYLFQEKDKQNTISHSGLCRYGNSDMCTWLSKASDIQAPLTESHHHCHHHSTRSAAGSARSETWVCRRRDDGAQNGSLLWSHAESKYNTAGLLSRLWTRAPTGRHQVPRSSLNKVLALQTFSDSLVGWIWS